MVRIFQPLVETEVKYRVHKSPPWGHILGQLNPVQNLALYFLKIPFNIISPKLTLPFT
jgi:hypothetical protein